MQAGLVEASSSTVRAELAELEDRGMLDHPHTSAGRVPTEAGYRRYATELVRVGVPAEPFPVDLSTARHELDTALRATTEALASMTQLLAAVSAPSLGTTEVRHVELLRLQPNVVMAVVITATGGVAKRLFVFDGPVDSGLVDWATTYLAETVTGLRLGARQLASRLVDSSLGKLRARASSRRSRRSSPSSPTTAPAGSSSAAPRRCSPSCAGATSRRSATSSPRSRSASTCSRSCAARSTASG